MGVVWSNQTLAKKSVHAQILFNITITCTKMYDVPCLSKKLDSTFVYGVHLHTYLFLQNVQNNMHE